MPKDIFGDMFSYFMYFMGIIIAVMLILMRVDAVSTSYVSDMAVSFVDECRTTGKISADNYQKTYEHICRTGSYDVSLSYDSAVAFPTDTGDVMKDWITTPNDKILEYMYDMSATENYDYPMNIGDTITITVTRKNASIASNVLSWMFGSRTDAGTLVTTYSGTVGTNGG